ncbi:hypothetical protein BOW22_11585, partial [Solemya velum gill symbiont]|uniref:reverse transcriptase domain-containing protein n=1 Tax=Solemya velum gill symbiont TaxID=2340 RepID=UPI0009C94A01
DKKKIDENDPSPPERRFCIDYRKLNQVTKINSYPLERIDDLIDTLNGAKFFTSLDLRSGYWQIPLTEDSKPKTAFATHFGLYEFEKMPFGICGAPGLFQELMTTVFRDCREFCMFYLDDICVFSKDLESHMKHVQKVFDKLRESELMLKLKKCSFLKKETEYLGFQISERGILPSPRKIRAIEKLSPPTTVRQCRAFIGLCGFYRRSIKAFEQLKGSLIKAPVLSFPKLNRDFILYTDSSDTCIGAVLTQLDDNEEEKPIYFLSHKLSDTQKRWSTVEKEAYAIHYSLQKLHHYLHRSRFVIRTDHAPLKYLLESPMKNRKIQLWALSMASYNCKIEYLKGTENVCADLLSRPNPKEIEQSSTDENFSAPEVDDRALQINVLDSLKFKPEEYAQGKVEDTELTKPRNTFGLDLKEEQSKDEKIKELMNQLETGDEKIIKQNKYIIMEGVLYYISNPDEDPIIRLYVPEHLRDKVLKQHHDDLGHMGQDKLFYSIREKYFWPDLYKQVYKYVNQCVTCQTRNLTKIKAPLKETDVPPYAFAKVAIDVSGPYPTSMANNKYIVTFIDQYSSWVECFATPDKTADTIVHLLLEEIFPRFGCPLEILTDNGKEFANAAMREVCKELNIHHVFTSTYMPSSNAKCERSHRVLIDVLSKKVMEDPTLWDVCLNQSVAALRFNINQSTKFSPFFLVYNRDVVLPLDNLLRPRRKY